jgi:hypothetical protein
MGYYVDVDGTEIAWQSSGDLAPTLQKWISEGKVSQHASRDGSEMVLINWRAVRVVRLDQSGAPLFRASGGDAA